jgi:hypothetical protein
LTYDDEHLPPNNSLLKKDLQKFFYKLRQKIKPIKIRYFAVGEYGSNKTKRPHYHIILFGYVPKDLEYFYSQKDYDIFISP